MEEGEGMEQRPGPSTTERFVTGQVWGRRDRQGPRTTCGFLAWATGWVVVSFTKTGHTEAPLLSLIGSLFVSLVLM